jgi:hypothetical protein
MFLASGKKNKSIILTVLFTVLSLKLFAIYSVDDYLHKGKQDRIQYLNDLQSSVKQAFDQSKQKQYRNTMGELFDHKDLEGVVKTAAAEIALFPIVTFNGLCYRYYTEVLTTKWAIVMVGNSYKNEKIPACITEDFEDRVIPFLKATKEGDYYVFYKGTPIMSLASIFKEGLDAKYGGIGGSTASFADAFPYLIKEHDIGRMFISADEKEAESFARRFTGGIGMAGVLKIKLTANDWFSKHLAYSYRGMPECFFVGNIGPENIEFRVIQSGKCSEYMPLTFENVKALALETQNHTY